MWIESVLVSVHSQHADELGIGPINELLNRGLLLQSVKTIMSSNDNIAKNGNKRFKIPFTILNILSRRRFYLL